MSDTNQESIIFCPEVTFGTTPTNATTWMPFPYTSDKFEPKYTYGDDETIRPDRNPEDAILLSATGEGTIEFNVRPTLLDPLLEAVLCGTWAEDVLGVGIVKRSWSLQKLFADLAVGNKYELAKGIRFGQLQLDASGNAITKGTLSLSGTSWADAAASIVGTGTVGDWPTSQVINGTTDVVNVTVDGAASGLYFDNISLTLGATLRAKTAIAHLFPFDYGYGSAMIQLTADMYFDDRSILTKYRSGVPMSFGFSLTDGSNTYAFAIPRGFITDHSGSVAGKRDDDIKPKMTLSGRSNTLGTSSVIVTRTLAG